MEFIVYSTPPLELMDFFHEVPDQDPIRRVLSSFTTFQDALLHLDENDFDNYGVFIRFRNPHNFLVYKQINFFLQKPRLQNITPIPIPPFYVYKRTVKLNMEPFFKSQQSWAMRTLVHRLFSKKDTSIAFVADDRVRHVPISSFLKEELQVETEPVPLLVLDTPEHSLEFAGFVMGLLHQTSMEQTKHYIQNNPQMLRHMSINHRRKMYDIFPEEFIHIPHHVWNTLKRMDDAELLEEDVQELCEKYKKLSITT